MHYFIAITLLIFSFNFIFKENIMTDFKTYEYIWLDGYTPEANMRSKVKATDEDSAPDWSFDGSSTLQAEGGSSDCLLLPVQTYENPNGHDLVMTQVQSAALIPFPKHWYSHCPSATSAFVPVRVIPRSRQACKCASEISLPTTLLAPTPQ